MVNQDSLVVGYVAIANIKEELYNSIKSGSIRNDIDLNPIMYDRNSKYHYLSSIVILDEYQKLGYGQKLLNCAIKEYNHNLITITISESGYALMNKVMKQVIKLGKEITIFEYDGENN